MKKLIIPVILMTAIFSLAACGTTASSTSANAARTPAAPNGTPGAFGQAPLSLEEQILVGSFKLEGTDLAVTSAQAAELLPLWQMSKTLSASDTSAPQEIEAVIEQIHTTMTAEQMQAISDMKLTRADMFSLMQEKGIETGFGGRANASGTPQSGQNPGGFVFVPGQGGEAGGVPGGGGGAGGFPGGGGAPGGFPGEGGGQNLNAEQLATAQARQTQRPGNANRLSSALLDALIQLLESKVQ